MAYYLRHTRVFGVPIQFAVVAAITTVVVVYLSGWAALSSSEARANLDKNAIIQGPAQSAGETITDYNSDIEKHTWERIALFVCPLH
tara:strand:- start:387 stop:647 length:261 start_codon:yes stop_codon:yes gene_type:complete